LKKREQGTIKSINDTESTERKKATPQRGKIAKKTKRKRDRPGGPLENDSGVKKEPNKKGSRGGRLPRKKPRDG